MLPFLSGVLALGLATAGVFFLKFWQRTRDSLFLMFGLAFFLQACERIVIVIVTQGRNEEHTLVYLFRLAAFALLLGGIANKNRQERR